MLESKNTKYEDIYARYRARVKDYNFLNYTEEAQAEMEHDLLMAAIDDFVDICKQDLTDHDDDLEEFNIELTRKEQSILALGMVCHWVEPFVYDSDALQNSLSTKDFSLYSPANLLEKMTTLMTTTQRQLRAEINLYSFRNGEIVELAE